MQGFKTNEIVIIHYKWQKMLMEYLSIIQKNKK